MLISEIIIELEALDQDQSLDVLVDGLLCGTVVLVCKGDLEDPRPYIEVRDEC